jgi:hypothetical protein
MAKSVLPIHVMGALNKLAKDIKEKQEIVVALEFLVKSDKLKSALDSTNKAIEREIDSNNDYLSKLKSSIKSYESKEKKAKEQEVLGVEEEREKAKVQIKSINEDLIRKRKWGNEKIAEVDDNVKTKQSVANRKERELNTNIAGLEQKHEKVRSAYEETKRLANV